MSTRWNKVLDIYMHAFKAYYEPDDASWYNYCTNFDYKDTKMDYATFTEYSDKVVFAFRGTDSADLIESGNFGIVRKRWFNNLDKYPMEIRGTIHNGFYDSWKPFKDWVRSCISCIQGKTIYVCGHSRGGALATLCHRHIVKNLGNRNTMCYTFGSPGIMTQVGVDEMTALGCRVINYINGYDIVTRIPYSLIPRPGEDVYIKEFKMPRFFGRISTGIKNHTPAEYKKQLVLNAYEM